MGNKKQAVQNKKPAKCWTVFAKVGYILGIVSVATCILPVFVSFIVGIHGIVFSCLGKKSIDEKAIHERTIGLQCSIAGLVINFVLSLVFWILFGLGMMF